ncbi:alpha-ketoglutarate-dependent dioxygenase AlkB family protein [Aliidiomarina sanyensis]|uniref:Alpha-ketoglutarate-dependent dioxygenase AlkB n=1 Tax=Aliidiomarina sanyensis TaxID=1249555 RepID=A0A432WDH2_9GAMM|nr:alpha-ketoglutarate-dependent dioxygenase AlkB [Aliidiomarina sanyensis]
MQHRIAIPSRYRLDAQDSELYYIADWLPINEANSAFQSLREEITWEQGEVFIFGKHHLTPRLQSWHGEPDAVYAYSNKMLLPKPWTPSLLNLKRKLEDLGIFTNSVLANLYRDGNDKMGWHRDNEKELGPQPVIASLSFGGQRDFVLRHRLTKQRICIPLENGSLFVMAGQTQHFWEHCLPRRARCHHERINLTYRTIIMGNPEEFV